jgi:predicted dehydrogenase
MKQTGKTRLGIIGMGLMGAGHAQCLRDGLVPGAVLAAACDPDRRQAADFPGLPWFDDVPALLSSGTVDAVVIATPHYAHTTAGVAALKAGLHVLVEKPVSVHKADVLKLLAAHRGRRQIFAAMFNQRTDPRYLKLRAMVQGGKLGKIRRINWIITDWFRPEAYYRHAGWRATWAGEGGGVLLNQCPHNLDLFQWIFGMPAKVRGFCQFGRYHDIEVEDDVTAYFEYADGTTAVFIASTGEAPGTNRLEVMGDRGRLVLEGGRLEFLRNKVSAAVFSRQSKEKFKAPPVQRIEVPLPPGTGGQHLGILKNFLRAIRRGEKLIAPAGEGLHSVELANAIILSALENRTVDMPLSAPRYARLLASLAHRSPKK